MLADTSGGVLFTIPAEDWTAIGRRVDAVIGLSGIAKQVSVYLLGFETLVGACQAWIAQTRPAIGAAAQSLARYCDTAITAFQQLKTIVSGPLTPQVQQQVADALTALTARTTPLNGQFHQLSGQITDFALINRTEDAQIEQYVARLGPDWRSILPQTSRVDDASGLMRGVWQALSADLNALVTERIDVSVPFIASLKIDVALAGWTGLRSEAQSFLAQHAAGTPA